jgi:hypothetical protein
VASAWPAQPDAAEGKYLVLMADTGPQLLRPHPLSATEDILWQCQWLVVGTGAHGALPLIEEAERG